VTNLVLRNARILGDERPVDVSIVGGAIAGVGAGIDVAMASEELDLGGRWLMPGLWDAHVHFTQWARFRGRIDVSGSTSAADAVARLVSGAAAGPWDGDVVIGRGYQDALWADAQGSSAQGSSAQGADAMTSQTLDVAFPGRAVVIVSHDLHSVWLNDAAAVRFGARSGGVLREAEAFAVEIALDAAASPAEDDVALRAAVAEASARGVVGIRDLEMADNPAVWASRIAHGLDALRVEACIYPDHLAASDARGLRGGDVVHGTRGLITVGGLKVFSDGSLNTLTALTHEPYGRAGGEHSVGHAAHSPEGLRELLAAAHGRGLEVALHAIGDAAVTHALDAFEATRARGTIEHAQLVAERDLPRFAELGIAASVQPQHAIDDRDVTDAIWADRAARAFPYRSLAEAGARLLMGSDAPVAPLDPWGTIAAAVHRSGDDRESWHSEQELSRDAAIAASVRGAVVVGEQADLVAVDLDPLRATAQQLRAMPVALTMVGGRITHRSGI